MNQKLIFFFNWFPNYLIVKFIKHQETGAVIGVSLTKPVINHSLSVPPSDNIFVFASC